MLGNCPTTINKKFSIYVCVCVLTGCSTLGKIPDNVVSDKSNQYQPTLEQVREWALDVADGYDSRATINKYSTYAGGSVAILSLAAITGLATYGVGHSWILGLPIFGTTTGAMFSLYQNEDKARIYRAGNFLVKELLVLSHKRTLNTDDDLSKQNKINEVNEQIAKNNLDAAHNIFIVANQELDKANQEALNNATLDTKGAEKKQQLDLKKKSLNEAELNYVKAKKDFDLAHIINTNGIKRFELKTNASNASNASNAFEATCLQTDVNNVMEIVNKHIELLDPQNVAKMYENIKKESTITIDGQRVIDLSDLQPPAKSSC